MRDTGSFEAYLHYDPTLISLNGINATHYRDYALTPVGFMNLPVGAAGRNSVTASSSIDNVNGAALVGAAYSGTTNALYSPDEPHPPGLEPYSAGPGVPLLRVAAQLKPASAGQLVTLDLTNSPPNINHYTSEDPDLGTEDVPVPDANLFDGTVAVSPRVCSGGTVTPTPTSTPPGPTPTATPTRAPLNPHAGHALAHPDGSPHAAPSPTPPPHLHTRSRQPADELQPLLRPVQPARSTSLFRRRRAPTRTSKLSSTCLPRTRTTRRSATSTSPTLISSSRIAPPFQALGLTWGK